MSEQCYAHFVHVNGELGDVDDEVILGPFPNGVQLTYRWLRENENGENIAELSAADGCWYVLPAPYRLGPSRLGPFSDVSFTSEKPESVLPEGGLRRVTFEWSTEYGECYDCGLPAAFESSEHQSRPESLRCAICAANDAAGGATIRRLDDEGPPALRVTGPPAVDRKV